MLMGLPSMSFCPQSSQASLGLLNRAACYPPGLQLICLIPSATQDAEPPPTPRLPWHLGAEPLSSLKSWPLSSLSTDRVWQVPTHSLKNI